MVLPSTWPGWPGWPAAAAAAAGVRAAAAAVAAAAAGVGRPCLERGSLNGPTHGQRYGKHGTVGLALNVGA